MFETSDLKRVICKFAACSMQVNEEIKCEHLLFVTEAWNLGESISICIGYIGNWISSPMFNVGKISL